MLAHFHVSSVRNRASIREHGLDWKYMSAAPGIAGSRVPEADGIFVCEEHTIDFFLDINNTGDAVDIWMVADVRVEELVLSSNGFPYVPATIPAHRLTLWKEGIPPRRSWD